MRKPLIPNYSALLSPGHPVVRAVLAHVRAAFKIVDQFPIGVARKCWPDDTATRELVERAATTQATTDVASWAGALAHSHVSELIANLGPASAGSQLLSQGMRLEMNRNASLLLPAIVADPSKAKFVGQGQAIPVVQLPTSGGVTISPKKIATSFVMTREMAQSVNAEQLARAVLTESLALCLDVAMFSNFAGDAITPRGLLAGAITLTATTGGGANAMIADLAALASAVAPIAGTQVAYVASPAEAVKIAIASGLHFNFPVYASSALSAKTVICAATNALSSVIDPMPEIVVSTTAAVHTDTNPADIVGGTSPGVAAYPTVSMFQTENAATRLIMHASWAMRAPNTVSSVANVTW